MRLDVLEALARRLARARTLRFTSRPMESEWAELASALLTKAGNREVRGISEGNTGIGRR
jgi:hypothetical protein